MITNKFCITKVYERFNRLYFKNDMPWGLIIKIHKIGDYQIIEYTEVETEKTYYKPLVNNNDTHHSFQSLDRALIHAVAYKYDGVNTRADIYYAKMLEMKEE